MFKWKELEDRIVLAPPVLLASDLYETIPEFVHDRVPLLDDYVPFPGQIPGAVKGGGPPDSGGGPPLP